MLYLRPLGQLSMMIHFDIALRFPAGHRREKQGRKRWNPISGPYRMSSNFKGYGFSCFQSATEFSSAPRYDRFDTSPYGIRENPPGQLLHYTTASPIWQAQKSAIFRTSSVSLEQRKYSVLIDFTDALCYNFHEQKAQFDWMETSR